MTLGLVKYCALPIYSGQENANLHPDSPNPASQIPRLVMYELFSLKLFQDGSMLNIAKENNLAETAFCVKREATVSESADAFYDIRKQTTNHINSLFRLLYFVENPNI